MAAEPSGERAPAKPDLSVHNKKASEQEIQSISNGEEAPAEPDLCDDKKKASEQGGQSSTSSQSHRRVIGAVLHGYENPDAWSK